MWKIDILTLIVFVSIIVMLGCNMQKVNTIQPTTETIHEVYICEIVSMPIYSLEETKPADDNDEISNTSLKKIDESFDILTPCGYSYEQLLYSVSDDYRCEMTRILPTIIEAEERYGVNALYLMCKLGLESGWAKYTSGENNLGGWTSADGSYMDFNSEEECVLYIAEKLSTEYKDISGTRLEDVCERYCPCSEYTETLVDIMNGRKDKIEEMECKFDE